jgi:hypothetical protein
MKTSELTGVALDWVVAKCEPDDTVRVYFDEDTGEKLCHDDWEIPEFNPSTNWAQGGPIIEREGINLWREDRGNWCASYPDAQDYWDLSPLVAAMRCYVASKLGDTVKIPGELLK